MSFATGVLSFLFLFYFSETSRKFLGINFTIVFQYVAVEAISEAIPGIDRWNRFRSPPTHRSGNFLKLPLESFAAVASEMSGFWTLQVDFSTFKMNFRSADATNQLCVLRGVSK